MYKDILLPVDLNDESSWKTSLPTAIGFCKAFGATLHVITVAPNVGMPYVGQFFPEGYEKKMEDAVLQLLHGFVEEHVPKDIRVQRIVSQGAVYHEILIAADDIGADLIIMGSHRPEFKDYLLGHNAARVVRHARCSVLVARG